MRDDQPEQDVSRWMDRVTVLDLVCESMTEPVVVTRQEEEDRRSSEEVVTVSNIVEKSGEEEKKEGDEGTSDERGI